MSSVRKQREEMCVSLLDSIKKFLCVSQFSYIKEHSEAFFFAPNKVFNQDYKKVVNDYVLYVGEHRNRSWVKKVKPLSPIEAFLEGSVSKEFDNDFLNYLSTLKNLLEDQAEIFEDGCNISELREDLENDLNMLEKSFERFAQFIKDDSKEYEKKFARLTNAFIRGGNADGVEFEHKFYNQIQLRLPSFGEAGEIQLSVYSNLKHQVYMLTDAIKCVLEYKKSFAFDFDKFVKLLKEE